MANQAIEKPAAAQRLTLRDYVMGPEVVRRLKDVASKYMQPDEIARCVLVAASRNPKIADCTQDSILRCMMEAAVIGIRPGGIMGRGWLIPRWNSKIKAYELNFDPGWRGLSDIARRSKVVKRIEARVVHVLDVFRVIEGTEPKLIHEPYDGVEDPGEVTAAYAIAFFAPDDVQFEVVWRRDLDKIAGSSTSKDDKGAPVGPWRDWYEEMARKSAVRRLCKHLPTDEELEYALEVATRAEMPAEETVPALPAEAEKPRAQQLADKIRSQQTPKEAEPEAEQPVADGAP
jgi:recombination protein RecT